jgi:hypothetical protein
MAKTPKWLSEPEDKDYGAAHSYLSLLLAPARLREAVALLKSSSALPRAPRSRRSC